MTVYYFLVAIPVLFYILLHSLHLRFRRLDNEQATIALFFTLYILLLCLRDVTVGIDVVKYIAKFFVPYSYYTWGYIAEISTEIGFGYLTKLIASLTDNPHVYLSVVALLSAGPLLILYRREATIGVLCISIFMISLLFEISFSGLRQAIAVAMAVPAFYATKNKKPLWFFLSVAASFLFHRSGLILLLMYPIYHVKITRKWLWFVLPMMALLYIFNRQVFSFLFQSLGGFYFDKYNTEATGYVPTKQFGQLALFFVFSIYSYVVLDEKEGGAEDIGLRNLLLLATALQCFAPLHVIACRMNYYFMVFIPVTVTRVSTHCKTLYKSVVKLAVVVMEIYFIYYFFAEKGDALQIFNYRFFF